MNDFEKELEKKFKTWRDIRNWAEQEGFAKLVKRMDTNNRCWNSSGEFGRDQVAICDDLRLATTEEELLDRASIWNEAPYLWEPSNE